MEELVAILVPLGSLSAIFIGITAITKAINDGKLKKRLIELGHLEPEKQWILQKQNSATETYANLKYGILLICVGAGFMAVSNLSMENDSTTIFGMLSILAGAGFLVYFVLMKYLFKKAD